MVCLVIGNLRNCWSCDAWVGSNVDMFNFVSDDDPLRGSILQVQHVKSLTLTQSEEYLSLAAPKPVNVDVLPTTNIRGVMLPVMFTN